MLNNLYRKLHILFASSVMLIITLVISFVVANTVHTEKINESTLFQRLTTLLIYQVESASSDMDKELKAYEEIIKNMIVSKTPNIKIPVSITNTVFYQ